MTMQDVDLLLCRQGRQASGEARLEARRSIQGIHFDTHLLQIFRPSASIVQATNDHPTGRNQIPRQFHDHAFTAAWVEIQEDLHDCRVTSCARHDGDLDSCWSKVANKTDELELDPGSGCTTAGFSDVTGKVR